MKLALFKLALVALYVANSLTISNPLFEAFFVLTFAFAVVAELRDDNAASARS